MNIDIESMPFPMSFLGEMNPDDFKESWVVKGHIPEESVSMLIGEPGSGKSFLAIDLACSILTGRSWHDHQVKQGEVVILAGEGIKHLRKRVFAWGQDKGIELSPNSIPISHYGASLIDEEVFSNVVDTLEKIESVKKNKISFIVIDTLSRNFGPGDENSAKDAAQFMRHMDILREDFNCAVLVVHHTGHGAKDRARGSSALRASVDVELQVKKSKDEIITLSCNKMKDDEAFDDQKFRLEQVVLASEEVHGVKVSSAVIKSCMTNENSFSLLESELFGLTTLISAIKIENSQTSASKDTWRDVFYKESENSNKESVRKAFSRAQEKLIQKMVIVQNEDIFELILTSDQIKELGVTVPDNGVTSLADYR